MAYVLHSDAWGFLSTVPAEGTAGDWSHEVLHAHQFDSYDDAASVRARHWFGSVTVKVRPVDPAWGLCTHEWQEQPGEPPVDACSRCGAVRS